MVHIGTSGWQYRHWAQTFYDGLPQARWLEHYAEHFETVELNNSFYNLPERRSFESWRERTPEGFRFAVKMSRFLTHIKKLNDPEEPVGRFLERAAGLGAKLGPVLLQLPPSLQASPERLDAVLALFPKTVRVAVEFRHDSWYSEEVRELLNRHGAGLCLADSPVRKTPEWRTTDWGFVRFHEGLATPRPCYGEDALNTWVERIRRLWKPEEEVFVYFNNDTRSCALRDAGTFAHLCRGAGLRPSQVTVHVKVR